MANEWEARIRRLQAELKRRKLDAAILVDDINRRYFTGLETSAGMLVVPVQGAVTFYTDFRYTIYARRVAPWLTTKNSWKGAQFREGLATIGKCWARVGFEGSIAASQYLMFTEALPAVTWEDVSGAVLALRSVKSASEIKAIRAAVALNDAVYHEVMAQVQPGMTEREIARTVKLVMTLFGGEGESFDTIACVGKNTAECHHHPDDTVLRNNQPLLIDMGVTVDAYCSDMTRTAFLGKPSKLYTEIYDIVLRANRAAVKAVKPGAVCGDIDAVARNIIEKAGYGKYFGHSLGHGVGLFIHEAPNFAARQTTVLKPGMVITVEPGIYLPGKIGVRIEDMVLVTRTGCEVLTGTPR